MNRFIPLTLLAFLTLLIAACDADACGRRGGGRHRHRGCAPARPVRSDCCPAPAAAPVAAAADELPIGVEFAAQAALPCIRCEPAPAPAQHGRRRLRR